MKTIRVQSAAALVMLSIFVVSGIDAYAGGSISFKWGGDKASDQHQVKHGHQKRTGPPDHAPAHGYRAKHQYRYYPARRVYHDMDRGLYFYMNGDNWEVGVSLPGFLQGDLGACVNLELDTENPYTRNAEHTKKYPPGRYKRGDI